MANKNPYMTIEEYYQEIEDILRKKNNSYLNEFLKITKEQDVFDVSLWLHRMQKQGKIPKEADYYIENLYGSIR
jgi:hypothetical protein